MKLLTRIALGFYASKAASFEKATKDPRKCQEEVLLNYVRRNKNTEFGRKFSFADIKSIEDYRKKVPLSDPESLLPYFMRMRKGENNVTISDRVVFFGSTSGTTSKPKLIPVTKFSMSKKTEAMSLWLYYIMRDHPGVLEGKTLVVISPEKEGYTEGGVMFGAESGHDYKTLPPYLRSMYALPPEVFDIDDMDSRYYCVLRIAMGLDIAAIGTLSPSMLVLLSMKIKPWLERILRDIEKGTIDPDLKISPGIRRSIEGDLKADPDRVSFLRAVFKEKKELLPKDLWPNLKIITCWKSGTMKLYLKELERYFGDTPIRDVGCLSTEAHGSITMDDGVSGGVLAIGTNFYEFIPEEDCGKENARLLLADELEKGKEYYIVVTTPAGLYRYNIDDIILVEGFYNKTPVINFVRKGGNVVSLAGEKLNGAQVNEAIQAVAGRLGVLLRFFCTTVQWGFPPRYVLLAEFEGEISIELKKKFLISMENELGNHNREYRWARQAQLLDSPILKVVRHGGFETYRSRRMQEGAHDSQFKVPELVGDQEFQKNFEIAEEIILGS